MTRTRFWAGVSVLWLIPGSVIAQEDDAKLVEAGRKVVKSLRPLPPGASTETFFEMMLGPDLTVGYVTVKLEAAGDAEKPLYRYSSTTSVRSQAGMRTFAKVKATLLRNFQPVEIEIMRKRIDKDGTRSGIQRAVIGAEKVTLMTIFDGEVQSRDVDRPKPPFIYGIETLVQHLDLYKHDSFLLREFDMQTGGAGTLIFTSEAWSDGTPTVYTRRSNGEASYQFWFDVDGNLVRWGEPSMPVIFKRATKERIKQLIPKFGTPDDTGDDKKAPSSGG